MAYKVIDISNHQNKLVYKDFERMKKVGVDGVVLRISYSQNQDASFDNFIQCAIKAGLHIGGYCFSYALDDVDAYKEATKVIDILAPYREHIDMPIFYDWEYDSMRYANDKHVKLTKSQITNFNKIFCQEISKAGYMAGVYYNYDIATRWIDLTKLDGYFRWIAFYSKTKPSDVDMWQYTSSGKITDISYKLDRDYCYTEFWKEKPMAVKTKGNLTKHFSVEEYAVACPSTATVELTPMSLKFARLLEKFRVNVKRKMNVTSWFRTESVNKKVGGIATSNHLTGTACDFHFNVKCTEKMFVKYAKMWKEICENNNVVGEAGLYSWGMHLGIQNAAQKKANKNRFFHWDTRSGKQKNNPFNI